VKVGQRLDALVHSSTTVAQTWDGNGNELMSSTRTLLPSKTNGDCRLEAARARARIEGRY
jgi:hypothetical protein